MQETCWDKASKELASFKYGTLSKCFCSVLTRNFCTTWLKSCKANHYLTYAKGCSNLCCRFRDLTRRCFPSAPANAVRCYELMCVHVGLVPVQFATKHIRSLASALFQTSLGAHYPISLIQWRHAFVIAFVLVSYWYRSSPFHKKRSSRTCKFSRTTRGLNIYLHFLRCSLNPLSPNSDQHQFSPNDIRTLSRD